MISDDPSDLQDFCETLKPLVGISLTNITLSYRSTVLPIHLRAECADQCTVAAAGGGP